MHGAMAKYIGRRGDFACYDREMAILMGASADCAFEGSGFNRPGEAEGMVVGGNMAVLGGLVGTPFDPIAPGTILFIEDIAEPIYKIERMLWQLRLRGVFDRLGGLLVGQFTEYRPSADHEGMEQMIARAVEGYEFPVAMTLPVGHIEENHPLLLNRRAKMRVDAEGVKLSYL